MKRNVFITLVSVLTLAACGGDGETVAGIDSRGTPVAVTVVSKGTISGFGSVIVNGVTFDTSNAVFTIDGIAGSQANLAIGQVVVVQGELGEDPTTGTADSVTFDDAVEGPVDAIDVVAGTMIVLGQTIVADADTSYDDAINPASLEGLAVNDFVEVSGFYLADGTISATRIELRALAGELELTGTVSNPAGTTFEINGFVVDFSAAMLEDFPGGTPEDGQLVEARGDALGGAGELMATRVKFKGGAFGDDGDRAEVEGYITRFDLATDFDVEGVPVITNAQTVFENGTSVDLALNRKVEVEGDIDATGVIVATTVEIRPSGTIRIESTVEGKQGNQLTILGITVTVNESTRIEDKSSAGLDPFGIDQVNVADYVEIRGYEDNGAIVATLLEREDFEGVVAIRGFVEAINDPDFTIFGITIQTIPATEFFDNAGGVIMAADFFGQAAGRLVEASGTQNGSAIVADEIELED